MPSLSSPNQLCTCFSLLIYPNQCHCPSSHHQRNNFQNGLNFEAFNLGLHVVRVSTDRRLKNTHSQNLRRCSMATIKRETHPIREVYCVHIPTMRPCADNRVECGWMNPNTSHTSTGSPSTTRTPNRRCCLSERTVPKC